MEIRVMQYMRRPQERAFSIERIFKDLIPYMPADIHVSLHANRFLSRGILRRLIDALWASCNQADINHVTGDVHYMTYFLSAKRTILTIHDCVSLQRTTGLKHWLLWLFWYWLPEKRSSMISVISESTRQQVLEYLHCDPIKVRVIHDNVSDEFQPKPKPFSQTCPRLLHIGTKANKNLERHAAAIEGLDCELVIIGPLSDAQEKLLARHQIGYESHFSLSRQELLDQYAHCDLLLFASTYEGFGLPIVEAQAVGRPVVTSNLWSMPEVAGEGACLVDPLDVSSIRNGVERIRTDANYRKKLIEQGFQNVKRFRTSVIAKQYAALYREVYDRSRIV